MKRLTVLLSLLHTRFQVDGLEDDLVEDLPIDKMENGKYCLTGQVSNKLSISSPTLSPTHNVC